ncbi:MAG: PPOX class F420-dependent oxidoreductase [Ktedonobacteraceae bacterium]
MFSEKELAYISSQRLLRLATVEANGQPDVDAVGFRFDGQRFYILGQDLAKTRKYKNVQAGNKQVSLIIDDLASTQPWTPRGIRLHGIAEPTEINGRPYLVITPTVSWSWGVDAAEAIFENGKFKPRKVIWNESEKKAEDNHNA